MWSILGNLTITIGIILYEVPSLLKRNLKRELWVFSILLIIGVILSIFKNLDIGIPNPFDWITVVYKPLTNIIFSILK